MEMNRYLMSRIKRNWDQIDDDALLAVPRSAVETSSDGHETLSDESYQEELDDHIDDDALLALPRRAVETSSDGYETLSYGSDQEQLDDHIDDHVLSDVSSDGDESLSDESDQEQLDDHIDDDALLAVPRSAVETSSDGHETLSDESDQEELDDHIDEDVLSGQLESSSEGPWDAMSPTLRCGGDLMNLQLFGSGVDQVELCRGGSAPVPLSHLPPNYGSTSPTHGGLVFSTPYDGCGVSQQVGNYVMQLLWQGTPVNISCPMT
ncbi:hypothetical protein E1301_Tti008701 [Triplophysa tibetana]|uniref:Uncharacterized protein n=1 Tax=Triplophysa tibetana TaxID=1572043 RepID=A0A5A9PP58_9TELE|nr:hypothetical protein E1301_Tti008701 [Triplophysa tibetana]